MNDIEMNKKLINLMESAMSEAAKPDYIDLDKDGDKEETMKKAAKDKKKMDEAEEKDGKMPSKAAVMKCCKDGMSEKEICDKYPDCDQKKLKELCKDCKEEMKEKEKTDEGLDSLKSILRDKMEEVMEAGRYAKGASKSENPEARTNSMPAKSSPTLGPEQTNGYRGRLVGEEEEVEEDVLDEAELDEMAEMMRMAGIEEASIAHNAISGVTSANNPRASTSSMPKSSTPTTGPEQTNGYRDVLVGEEDEHGTDDHDAKMDDEAEEAGEKATHQIELDRDEHEAMKSLLKKLLDN